MKIWLLIGYFFAVYIAFLMIIYVPWFNKLVFTFIWYATIPFVLTVFTVVALFIYKDIVYDFGTRQDKWY